MNQSSAFILEYLDGSKKKIPAKTKCFVDVRDVALCHVLAFEKPQAAGQRYLLISSVASWKYVCGILKKALDEGLPADVSAEERAKMLRNCKIPSEVEDGPVPYPQALFRLVATGSRAASCRHACWRSVMLSR